MGQKWVKNTFFQKLSWTVGGAQVNFAHFEPVLTQLSPLGHMYAPSCTVRTYLRAILWSGVELGRGV